MTGQTVSPAEMFSDFATDACIFALQLIYVSKCFALIHIVLLFFPPIIIIVSLIQTSFFFYLKTPYLNDTGLFCYLFSIGFGVS